MHSKLVEELIPIARAAGAAIIEIYQTVPAASLKSDGSPVTLADQAAETLILVELQNIAPDIPVISEENAASHQLSDMDRYFLVDPLDGTKEFLKRDGKGAFTVNIALIENGIPVAGVIYAPALDQMYAGDQTTGASMETSDNRQPISVRNVTDTARVAVASVSHRDEQTNAWLADNDIRQIISMGSSLKFCLLAAGKADVYPRFSPTMEWDTAAGDAILRAAGGSVVAPEGQALAYGKPGYRNGAFIAHGCKI